MTDSATRADLGRGFDNVPEIYDRIRPGYPEPLFDDLLSFLDQATHRDLRAVEIGPGTGQATRSLLQRGIAVTAVEPGERLAAYLTEKLRNESPGLEVVNATFEECALESGAYDLILAATSFHWIDPRIRLQKSHDLLREGGALAVISTNQIRSSADKGFFDRVQPVYKRHREDKLQELPGPDVTPPEFPDVQASRLFAEPELHRYRWDQTYTSRQYADLVRSYSGTQAMEPAAQDALIADLCAVIDAEFGGSVTRPLVITLTLARKRPQASRE